MNKKFIKKKLGKNAAGPKFRTADHFRGRQVGGKIKSVNVKFNPGQFKIQHKG